jgi:hypothetical protein
MSGMRTTPAILSLVVFDRFSYFSIWCGREWSMQPISIAQGAGRL